MKEVMMIVGIVLLAVIVGAAVAFRLYWRHNTHWFDKYEKALKIAGAEEKQVTLPNGNVINYGEVSNEKPALLLIHGQMSIWEDYALVLPELGKNWHIYAVDVYGHGESTHDESLYYLDVNGDDLVWFVDHVIGAPTVVAGHSNGAITAAYIAAYGGQNIAGVVLEDPPVFSTEGEGWEERALLILIPISLCMIGISRRKRSVGKATICDIVTGGSCTWLMQCRESQTMHKSSIRKNLTRLFR